MSRRNTGGISGRTGRSDLRLKRSTGEAGDTLIEILIAITVLGLVGIALIGGFGVATGASAEYRNLAAIDSVLKNFAESATNQIQLQSSPIFSACATAGGQATSSATTMQYAGHALTYQPPANYTIQITQVEYLYNNATFSPNTPPTTCDNNQQWPQLITANAIGPKGVTQNLSFVVMNPQYETYVTPTTTVSTTTTVPATTTTTATTIPTTTTTIPTTTTTLLAPTITFPTTASPYYAGHNKGSESLLITGTNLLNATVTVSGAFTLDGPPTSDTATSITVNLTGSGGNNALGTLTVSLSDGSSATFAGNLINGGTYNGDL